MTLPDIDTQSWDDYEKQRLQQQLDDKTQEFSLGHAINSKISEFTGWANAMPPPLQQQQQPTPEQAPPEPAAPPPLPEPPPTPAAPEPAPPEAPPAAPPEPAPAPEPLPTPSQSQPVAPEPAPAAPTSAQVAPTSAPSGLQDWITQSAGAVARSGGDVKTYLNSLSTQGDLVGNAIGSAAKSGANVSDFASSLAPVPPPAPTPGGASGAGASTLAPTPGGDLQSYARQAAARAGIDPDVFQAQIQQESGFNPNAKSGAGALGIAQFMPGTAQGMGIDPTDPYAALDAAAKLDAQNLQRYGGDYSKALAAYNAGPGAVDKYGGVPPFEETQRYVSTIMGAGKQALQGAGQAIGNAASAVGGAVKGAASTISQFGDSQLSADEAYAACGPAAAVRFAQAYGRNPTLREATDLAKTVGWTSAQGMAGLSSEKSLMDKMGIPTRQVGPDIQAIAAEAQTGNPVTISTQGHYFTADGYDPTSGAFHVGRSGTDLKGGSEWMTPDQMSARMGPIQGALLADNPQVPAPSTTAAPPQNTSPLDWLGERKDSIVSAISGGSSTPAPTADLTSRYQPYTPATAQPDQSMASVSQPTAIPETQPAPQATPVEKLKSAFGDFLDSLGGAAGNLVAAPGGGQMASQQATPSDTLTNPLGTGNASTTQPTPSQPGLPVRALEQPAAPLQGPAVLPSLDQAQQLLRQGDVQGAQDALGQARQAVANSAIGPGLGALRGPMLLSDEEILSGADPRDIANARAELSYTRPGEAPGPPPTDAQVAEQLRWRRVGQAAAMNEAGGPEGDAAASLSRQAKSPATEAAAGLPRTGLGLLSDAFSQLENYPAEVAGPIRAWAESAQAPASTIAATVQRWMGDNPIATVMTSASPEATAARAVGDLDSAVRGRVIRGPAPGGPEAGQLPLLGDQPYQPLMPEGAGEGGVSPVQPSEPTTTLEQDRMIAEQRRYNAERAARGETPGPAQTIGEGPLTQTGLLPDQPYQAGMPEGTGGASVPAVEPARLPGPEVPLPKWVPKPVQNLIQSARIAVPRDAVVDQQALQDLADKAGTTVERIQKVWKTDSTSVNHPVIQALSQALDDSAANLQELQRQLKRDPTHADSVAEMVQQLTRHQSLQEVAAAIPPEAGAALDRMKPSTISGRANAAKQLEATANRFKMTPEQFAQHLSEVDMTDPANISNLAQIARGYTFGDKVAAAWYFAMLSSPKTHIRNMIGNTAVAATRPLETAVASAFDLPARKLLGETGPRQRYLGEAGQEVQGMLAAMPEGVRQGWRALREGWVPETSGGFGQFNREAMRGTPFEFVGYPGRALQAEDQFFRAMNEGGSKFSLAYREAKQAGFKGAELADEWAKRIANPSEDMLKAMDKEASYRTFQQDSQLSESLNRMRQQNPSLRYLLPFTRTPINIMKYVAERSPLGAAKMLSEAVTPGGRAAFREAGSGALSDRMARATIGSVTWKVLYDKAMDGNLTGAAPSDATERDAFYRDGKQPYSFRRPGSNDWISYQALNPYSVLLSTAADTANAVKTQGVKDPNDVLAISSAAAASIGKAMINQPWTQGISDLLDAWGSQGPEGDAKIGAWAMRQAGGLMPGAMRDLAHAVDPVVRDPQNLAQAVVANVPYASKLVPGKVDAFGQERQRPDSGLWSMLNPAPMSSETTDPVELELQRLSKNHAYSVEPGLVGKNITAQYGNFGQDVELTDPQQRKYQVQAGTLAKSYLDNVVGSDEWKAMPDPEKEKFINNVYAEMRKAVRTTMAPELFQQATDAFNHQLAARNSVATGNATPGATPTEIGSTATPAGAEG